MLIRQRKLTKNQTRRIAKNADTIADDELYFGVIVSHFGKQLAVQCTTKKPSSNTQNTNNSQFLEIGQVIRCHTRTNLPLLATGDRVGFSFDETTNLGRIEKLLPRTTLIARPDRYHKLKPVASNSELLVVVFAPLPKPATNLIDRYLLISHLSDVPTLLVLNKADLLPEHPEVEKIYEEYQSLGIDIIKTSVNDKVSIHQLKTKLQDKLALFAGQSGVGKSSLINQILPNAEQATNIISELSKLGQHTTTTSRLLFYDNTTLGGIIDTPGIREYGVWHLAKDDIFGAFYDLLPYKGDCQFRDCNHTHNAKGCALWQAAAQGKVLARRIESLLELQAEAN